MEESTQHHSPSATSATPALFMMLVTPHRDHRSCAHQRAKSGRQGSRQPTTALSASSAAAGWRRCDAYLARRRAREELAASGADVGDVIAALDAVDDLGAGVGERRCSGEAEEERKRPRAAEEPRHACCSRPGGDAAELCSLPGCAKQPQVPSGGRVPRLYTFGRKLPRGSGARCR